MHNVLIVVQALMVMVCAAFIVILLLEKASYLNKLILACSSFALVQNAGYLVEICAQNEREALAGCKVKYLGCAFVLTMLLIFIIQYCRVRFPHPLMALFLVTDTLVLVGVWTYPMLKIYYMDAVFVEEGTFMPYLDVTRGLIYYVYILVQALEMLACLVIAIYTGAHERVTARRKNCHLIAVGVIVGAAPYLLQMSGVIPVFDMVPMFTALATIIFIVGTLRYHLFDLAETAEAMVLQELDDPVIVLDQEHSFIYANDKAKQIIPELAGYREGTQLSNDFILAGYLRETSASESLPEVSIGDETYYVKFSPVKQSSLKSDTNDFLVGYQVVLTDVSVERANQVADRAKEVQKLSTQSLEALAGAIDAKDEYTNGHSSRVSRYAAILATAAGMQPERVESLRYAALLHDIGKIGVPDRVLNKPGRLDDEEFKIIQMHTTKSVEILKHIDGMEMVKQVALHHHERYDGKGYPDKLMGLEIPYEARIVGICDSYDAMHSDRVYRKGLPDDVIESELVKGRGTQFDPLLDDVFLALMREGALEAVK